jgi:hypothetical protein
MGRHLDLIRKSALPSHQMMAAAKGALHVPAEEMVEILVYLADNNRIFGEPARMTLASWDEASAKAIVSNPATSQEVLKYWLSAKNLRPVLFPLLLENPSVSLQTISDLGTTLKGEWIDAILASPRIRKSQQVLRELESNKQLTGVQTARLQELISGRPTVHADPQQPAEAPPHDSAEPTPDHPQSASTPDQAHTPDAPADPETEQAVSAFMKEHAAEIATEGNKPFQPITAVLEDSATPEPQVAAAAAAAAAASPAPAPSGSPAKTPAKKVAPQPPDEQRGSVLQKIAKLDVKGRIQLAMKGSKEERSILVRDGTKLVALAVLDSPKISDGEVEKIASQKNVLEAVLRAIPMKRRFAKNYAVVRNLIFNPRTPLDVALGLMKNLLVQDLRNLSSNKEVSDTIRKLGLRMFKQKIEHGNKN